MASGGLQLFWFSFTTPSGLPMAGIISLGRAWFVRFRSSKPAAAVPLQPRWLGGSDLLCGQWFLHPPQPSTQPKQELVFFHLSSLLSHLSRLHCGTWWGIGTELERYAVYPLLLLIMGKLGWGPGMIAMIVVEFFCRTIGSGIAENKQALEVFALPNCMRSGVGTPPAGLHA